MNMHAKIRPLRFEWDEETTQKAAELWNDGQTASAIGALFGVSKNAVIGLAHRKKDLFKAKRKGPPLYARTGGKPPVPRSLKEPAGATSSRYVNAINVHKARMEAVQREAEEFETGTSPLMKIHASDAERLPKGKELHDLEPNECKWPLNHGSPFLFCAEATGGERYCLHHSMRAYRPKGSE